MVCRIGVNHHTTKWYIRETWNYRKRECNWHYNKYSPQQTGFVSNSWKLLRVATSDVEATLWSTLSEIGLLHVATYWLIGYWLIGYWLLVIGYWLLVILYAILFLFIYLFISCMSVSN